MSKSQKRHVVAFAAGIFLLVGALNFSTAKAETAKTSKSTRVMQRPGESSRVVTRVRTGAEVKVLARRGRWVKVRVNGRTGWVTRTSLSTTRQARGDVRKTRRRAFVDGRSKRRGWSGDAPDDRVGADATDEGFIDEDGPRERRRTASRSPRRVERDEEFIDEGDFDDEGDFEDEGDFDDEGDTGVDVVMVTAREANLRDEPTTRSESVFSVTKGEKLYVVEKEGKWMLVEDEGGDAGWIHSDDVKTAGGGKGYTYPKLRKRATARIGYSTIAQKFASDGMGELSAYKISSGAASIDIGGDLIYKWKPKYLIKVDLGYKGTRATPGIRYENAAGETADIGFTIHDINAGLSFGYNLQNSKGMVIYARAGYHYEKFGINNVGDFTKNLAYLPSEILKGITIGAHVDIPMITKKIGLKAGLDAMKPAASRSQTSGLEDGAKSSVFAAWGGAAMVYRWKKSFDIVAAYRYTYAKTKWTGAAEASMRPHGATEAARKDTGHSVTLGVGKSF